MQPEAVAKAYAEDQRPPFRHFARRYPAGLKEYVSIAARSLLLEFQVDSISSEFPGIVGCFIVAKFTSDAFY